MKNQGNYRLNRAGEFTVNTTGPNHCGTTDVLTIRYRLTVACSSRSLDARGFLFDQVAIDRWFQAQRVTALSCENYAAFCGRELYKLIKRENAGLIPTKLDLALSPAPFAAEIIFEWESDGVRVASKVRTAEFRPQNGTLDIQVGLFA